MIKEPATPELIETPMTVAALTACFSWLSWAGEVELFDVEVGLPVLVVSTVLSGIEDVGWEVVTSGVIVDVVEVEVEVELVEVVEAEVVSGTPLPVTVASAVEVNGTLAKVVAVMVASVSGTASDTELHI